MQKTGKKERENFGGSMGIHLQTTTPARGSGPKHPVMRCAKALLLSCRRKGRRGAYLGIGRDGGADRLGVEGGVGEGGGG